MSTEVIEYAGRKLIVTFTIPDDSLDLGTICVIRDGLQVFAASASKLSDGPSNLELGKRIAFKRAAMEYARQCFHHVSGQYERGTYEKMVVRHLRRLRCKTQKQAAC